MPNLGPLRGKTPNPLEAVTATAAPAAARNYIWCAGMSVRRASVRPLRPNSTNAPPAMLPTLPLGVGDIKTPRLKGEKGCRHSHLKE